MSYESGKMAAFISLFVSTFIFQQLSTSYAFPQQAIQFNDMAAKFEVPETNDYFPYNRQDYRYEDPASYRGSNMLEANEPTINDYSNNKNLVNFGLPIERRFDEEATGYSADEASRQRANLRLQLESLFRQTANDLQSQGNQQQLEFNLGDLNSHLRANGYDLTNINNNNNSLLQQQDDIEALIGELTGNLNKVVPNTNDRSQSLQKAMASYLNSAVKTSQRPMITDDNLNQQTNNDDDDDEDSNYNSKKYAAAFQQRESQNNEIIDALPLALANQQLEVQGGAGEGKQLLGPDGSFENAQVIKTDQASAAYCDPPNPCPKGFTRSDGCLEQFVNTATFSREYQAQRDCSCDNEHSLFNCQVQYNTNQNNNRQLDDNSNEADLDNYEATN